jgi:hypothetical protein
MTQPTKDRAPRRDTKAAIDELIQMIQTRDARFVGKTTGELCARRGLTEKCFLEIMAQYPAIVRKRETTNLWGFWP